MDQIPPPKAQLWIRSCLFIAKSLAHHAAIIKGNGIYSYALLSEPWNVISN